MSPCIGEFGLLYYESANDKLNDKDKDKGSRKVGRS
jgi:hypothetical protein